MPYRKRTDLLPDATSHAPQQPGSTLRRVLCSTLIAGWMISMTGCGLSTERVHSNALPLDDSAKILQGRIPPEMGPEWATQAPRVDLPAELMAPSECLDSDAMMLSPSHNAPLRSTYQDAPEFVLAEDLMGMTMIEGMPRERPRDEYVHDGGDRRKRVRVRSNWRVDGLDPEDTIAHFDTLAGDVEVVASNSTAIYSPRFAATRQVQHIHQTRVDLLASKSSAVDRVANENANTQSGAVKQPMGTVRAVGTAMGTIVEEVQQGHLVDDVRLPRGYKNALTPVKNLSIITQGIVEVDQQESVIHFANAAKAWSAIEFAQATVVGMKPHEKRGLGQANAAVTYDTPDGKPALRLVKLASVAEAVQGDTVEFTLRFDNIGTEPIGNVTMMDHLTPRLEYVEDSQKCSRKGNFSVDRSSSDTLQLRWEITEPMQPGEGGVITFQCRVL